MKRRELAGRALGVVLLLTCIGLSTWSCALTAEAQIFEAPAEDSEVLPIAAGRVLEQGDGYQLVESEPSLTDGDSFDDETGEVIHAPQGSRRIWIFEDAQGVETPRFLRNSRKIYATSTPDILHLPRVKTRTVKKTKACG